MVKNELFIKKKDVIFNLSDKVNLKRSGKLELDQILICTEKCKKVIDKQ